MVSPLAVPTFVSGASDKLAAVDVYTASDDSIVTAIPDVLEGPDPTTVSALRGGASAAASLPLTSQLTATKSGGFGVSSLVSAASPSGAGSISDLISKVAGSISPSLASSLRSLTPSIASAITAKMGLKLPGLTGTAGLNNLGSIVSVGGLNSLIKGANLGNASALLNTVNSLTGTQHGSALNLGSVSGLVSGLVSQASKLGVPGVFTALKPQLTTPGQVSNVVRSSLPDVISNSDVSTLNEFAMEPGVVSSVNSSAIEDFSDCFQPPVPYTTQDYQNQFSNINTTYSAINPNWASTDRLIGTTIDPSTGLSVPKIDSSADMTTTLNASPEFQKTMTTGAIASTVASDKSFLVATAYTAPDPVAQLKQYYPLAAAQVTPPAVPQDTDPRVAAPPPAVPTSGWQEESEQTTEGYNGDPDLRVDAVTYISLTNNTASPAYGLRRVTTTIYKALDPSQTPIKKSSQYFNATTGDAVS